MIISCVSGALTNEHKMQSGWVLVQIPHLTFGGNQGMLNLVAHVVLMVLTFYVVARSLTAHLT
jgi:hypothetical protein